MNDGNKQAQKNTQEETSSWMNHPNLAGMDTSKLAMLNAMARQGANKNPNDLLPFLMAAASKSKSKGLRFSPDEIDRIIQVLKMGKSPAETERIERLLSMLRFMR